MELGLGVTWNVQMETSIWNTIGLEHEQVECESHIDILRFMVAGRGVLYAQFSKTALFFYYASRLMTQILFNWFGYEYISLW